MPGGLATTGEDGLPNVTYVSQAIYVDDTHLALSFQFFNKTRDNIMFNPMAGLLVMDPTTVARYRLQIVYVRTETEGVIFEKMRAKLAGIAQHEGLVGVFELRGADIYRVLSIERLPGKELPNQDDPGILLQALHEAGNAIADYQHLEDLIDKTLTALHQFFEIEFSQFWLADNPARKLVALASFGYEQNNHSITDSGIGAEIPFGVGVIGVAAFHQTPIRILFAAQEWAYSRTVREHAITNQLADNLEAHIPLPGLSEPASQLALPISHRGRLLGVLYVESEQRCCFGYDVENALTALCHQIAEAIQHIEYLAGHDSQVITAPHLAAQNSIETDMQAPLKISYFNRDHSVFIEQDYLIKGVAGAIFWYLVNQYVLKQRSLFSNRELRLDPNLPLPDITDNLEARLLLLKRRLEDKNSPVQIEKCGRGQFQLVCLKTLALQPQD